MTINNNVTMHGSHVPAAATPDQQGKSDVTPEWAQQFAAAQGPATSGQMPDGGTGIVNSEISDESMAATPHRHRATRDLPQIGEAHTRAVEAYKQRLEAHKQRQEARELAETYRLFSLAPVEAGIAAERDALTKLAIAPGDELKEKGRNATLDALDKMEAAIADYKKSGETGPQTTDAQMQRMEDLGSKLVDISKKLRDRLEIFQMAHEIQTLKKKVDELESKQNQPSLFDIVRSIVNPVSSITWLPGIAKSSTSDQTG